MYGDAAELMQSQWTKKIKEDNPIKNTQEFMSFG